MPLHGQEFFFSNVMIKVYQVPMMFIVSSEFAECEEEGCFIVLVFEKHVRKRTYAKTSTQKSRLNRAAECKRRGQRHAEDSLQIRESKMRRFCNYFLTLFNIRRLTPFVQFIKPDEIKALKLTVRSRIDIFFSDEHQ